MPRGNGDQIRQNCAVLVSLVIAGRPGDLNSGGRINEIVIASKPRKALARSMPLKLDIRANHQYSFGLPSFESTQTASATARRL